ncbi:hypothetical protein ATY76_13300 [Rhizobium sp. R339]|uniref:hypothetical protein n=1 Tax=Rhizobium sp. R339 TaxID=1764273 RepID=UPI000B5344AA|nr:hypothetical protein [Rhizobium sp. R339]OWV67901.1 hypothetical protein ATY76_13300 [Rhizobium sp. R339]
MSDEMKWLPVRWMDEYVPDPQGDPNAFIGYNDEIGFYLRPVEDQDSNSPDQDFGAIEVKEGETVRFYAMENYGDFTLIVRDDGTFETDREIPAKANCFRLDRDTDTLQPSLSELVNNGYFGETLKPGSHDIDAYWWSEEEYAFAFSIVDSKGRLTQVGVVQ